MAWEGFLTVGGNEIVNNTRVSQYAVAMRVPWWAERDPNPFLPAMLGDGDAYRTPLLDDAPWTDPDVPESYDFLGFYCLEVRGIEDSTRTAELVQYLDDGGSTGRVRHGTKSVVFNGLLVALSGEGADYGMRWLRQATLGGPCGGDPFGGDLCYLSASPSYDPLGVGADPQDCLEPYLRTLRKFKVAAGGPTITQKYPVTSGALWGVQFAGTAGRPWEFAPPVDVVSGFLGPNPTGIATGFDLDGQVVYEADCSEPAWTPMNDPLCPVLISPPGPTNVPLGCVQTPANWRRRQFTIPAGVVRLWSDMVPVVDVYAPTTVDLRNLRLRFYSDPFDEANPDADPCAYCGDLLISYVPQGAVLTFDAASEEVYVTLPGGIKRRADNLVYASGGKPFEWPALTCGFAYTVTVDLPQLQALPMLDLSLVPLAR